MANENGNVKLYDLLKSEGDLWKSATIEAMKAALNITSENPNTDHHEVRRQWAYNVLSDPDQWMKDNKWNLLQNVTLVESGNKSTDNDISSAVTKLVPAQAIIKDEKPLQELL